MCGGVGWRRDGIGTVGGEGGDHLIDLGECKMVLLLIRGGTDPGDGDVFDEYRYQIRDKDNYEG